MAARIVVAALFLSIAPVAVHAVTIDDIVALSTAGVGTEILVAVIDADRTVFTLTRDDIVRLRQAGVPDRVIVKMLASAREFAEEPPPPLVVGGDPAPPAATAVIAVPTWVPYPWFVTLPVIPGPLTYEVRPGFGRFMNDGWVDGRGFGRFINDGWVDGGRVHRPAPRR
jgi:hypothetical protein